MGVVLSCGRRIRISDLQVMSLTSYLCSTPQYIYATMRSCVLEPRTGIEPATCWLQISCSTNWAISAKVWHLVPISFRLSVDLNASRFHHFRGLYTPDSHQVGKMRTVYRLRVSYIVIYSRVQAKCPCGFRRCLLLHCPYLRYSDFTLRVPSGCILQQHNRIVSQCVQHFCFFTLINP